MVLVDGSLGVGLEKVQMLCPEADRDCEIAGVEEVQIDSSGSCFVDSLVVDNRLVVSAGSHPAADNRPDSHPDSHPGGNRPAGNHHLGIPAVADDSSFRSLC